MKSYLNLGCGTRFHPEWTNVDFVGSDTSILSHNLLRGIPFPDETFDVVYHSHLLEHLPRTAAKSFLSECHRVLKIGGIIRLAIPDLEQIARVYLRSLGLALEGETAGQQNYEWMMIELLDQIVRDRPRGEMGDYLEREYLPNREFIRTRIGDLSGFVNDGRLRKRESAADSPFKTLAVRITRRLRRLPRSLREQVLRVVLGAEYDLLKLGRFRTGGEPHMWMYDRYSINQILIAAGFDQPSIVGAAESRIPDWTSFQLDTEPDGSVYKPDSLFAEATK